MSEHSAFRSFGRLTSTLTAGLLTAGLGMGVAQAEDVKIGVFVPTTGVLAPLGNDMKNGFELAAKGATVKGEPVRLIIEDTAANPANGLRKAQKLAAAATVNFERRDLMRVAITASVHLDTLRVFYQRRPRGC